MANLLPNEIKKSLWRGLILRKLIVAGFAIGSLLLLVIIVLSSFYFSLLVRQGGSAKISSVTSQELLETDSPDDPIALLTKVSRQTKVLDSYWQEALISEIVSKGLSLKPEGLKIIGVITSRGELGQTIKLSLVGTSNNRNNLVNYVNLLKQSKFFSRVDLPVESLISDTGGQFVINLEK